MGAENTQDNNDTSSRAKPMEMCQWILEAWLSISQDIIVKSFKVTGICNKTDGSENDFLLHQFDEESCQEGMTGK
jgi:hypothetical protein